jgi:hypothetical protein
LQFLFLDFGFLGSGDSLGYAFVPDWTAHAWQTRP